MLLCCMMLACTSLSAQNDKIEDPQFPGGRKELIKYMEENLVYPDEMRRLSAEGEVLVGFFVEPNGVITGVTVVKGLTKEFDEEAKRLVRNMPYWIPGKKNDVPVRFRMTMPINFKIEVQSGRRGNRGNEKFHTKGIARRRLPSWRT